MILYVVLIAVCWIASRQVFVKYLGKRSLFLQTAAVLGSGGHTSELLNIVERLPSKFIPFAYFVSDNDKFSEEKLRKMETDMGIFNANVYRVPRPRNVGQSYFSSILTTLRSTFSVFSVIYHCRPDLVLAFSISRYFAMVRESVYPS